ncbi:rhodanese-like domain-containing protein [Oceanidesulfovibrio indonesiensis]|uniref:Rhodanese-like domain-containing protein n=1 Tax=Oceanidesulfovibrio indonesiensis TaxID=54767 RepID=A0A7M3MAL8_9BACT|nr:rhodanese-like domain-containing protein [Oceanidesulfovibrio indonesiensis]TVM14833.1 rhodanese-like domain-containing protein [Oceanidesulfovibrio indonesiensis]
MKRLIAFAALVLALTAFASPASALFGSDKFEKELEMEAAVVKYLGEAERGDYQTVDTPTLKQWIEEGKDMIIVDTMPFEDSYAKEHIPGALNFVFPIPDMDEWDASETSGSLEEFETLLGPDKDKTIVIYCGFVKCTRSHNGAAWARKLGYTDVYRQPGGIFAWKGAKHPTESAK